MNEISNLNNMKIIKIIFCLILLLPAFNVYGDNNIIPFKQKGTGRPTDTGSDDNITCTFAQGQLRFLFREAEGTARLTIIRFDDGDAQTTTFSTKYPYYYYIGTEPGTYTLNVKTAKNEYEGVLEIQ